MVLSPLTIVIAIFRGKVGLLDPLLSVEFSTHLLQLICLTVLFFHGPFLLFPHVHATEELDGEQKNAAPEEKSNVATHRVNWTVRILPLLMVPVLKRRIKRVSPTLIPHPLPVPLRRFLLILLVPLAVKFLLFVPHGTLAVNHLLHILKNRIKWASITSLCIPCGIPVLRILVPVTLIKISRVVECVLISPIISICGLFVVLLPLLLIL